MALTQAAATLRQGHTGPQYLQLLSQVVALDEATWREDGDPYPATVGAALQLAINTTIERIRNHPNMGPAVADAATRVLDALALLAETGVPRHWLLALAIEDQSPHHVRRALAALVESWVAEHPTTRLVRANLDRSAVGR